VLTARADVLKTQKDLVRKFVAAHEELTEWIKANPAEAQRLARDELTAETRANVSADLIARSMKRIVLTRDVSPDALAKVLKSAQGVGFLRDVPELSRLLEKP
jgi:NitT/TauT family transport system substrate-binding protein